MQREDAQPVIEVGAELPVARGLFEIAVRGGDDAHVDLAPPGSHGVPAMAYSNGSMKRSPSQNASARRRFRRSSYSVSHAP